MRATACPPHRIEVLPAEITLQVDHLPEHHTLQFVRKGADCPIELPPVQQSECEVTALLPEKLADCGPGIYEVFVQSGCDKLCAVDVEFVAGCRITSVTINEASDAEKDCC